MDVTDPNGANDIAGGTLTDPTGNIVVGNLSITSSGKLTITFDWSTLNAAWKIEFNGPICGKLGLSCVGQGCSGLTAEAYATSDCSGSPKTALRGSRG